MIQMGRCCYDDPVFINRGSVQDTDPVIEMMPWPEVGGDTARLLETLMETVYPAAAPGHHQGQSVQVQRRLNDPERAF